jgi:hypothetical protein
MFQLPAAVGFVIPKGMLQPGVERISNGEQLIEADS